MEIKECVHLWMNFWKIAIKLAFFIVFVFWAGQAVIKFAKQPIASSISYTVGDDGYGNYEFPAITICLDSFGRIGTSYPPLGMYFNCSYSTKRYCIMCIITFHQTMWQ